MREIEVNQNILDLFSSVEGVNTVYYGKVRNGKTYAATADILELLDRGEIVYANWLVKWEGYDQRRVRGVVFLKTLFGKKTFFVYKKENFHYMEPDGLISGEGQTNVKHLNRLVGVHIFIDEGQWVIPSLDRSHDEESLAKMRLVLHGGHYCRSLNIITQRATNISKNSRSQINIWFRCEKRFHFGNFILFQRWAIEDMKDDMPVEYLLDEHGKKVKPNGTVKSYLGNKRIFKAYNTHGMRAVDAIEPSHVFEAYQMTFWDSVRLFFNPRANLEHVEGFKKAALSEKLSISKSEKKRGRVDFPP